MKLARCAIICALIIATIFVCCYKPSIHDASIRELAEIPGIGDVLASEISTYCAMNKNADIDDLILIDGIGYIRMESIKERYR